MSTTIHMGLVYNCSQVQFFVLNWVDPITGNFLQPEVFIIPIPEVREAQNFAITLVSQLYLHVVQIEVVMTSDGHISYRVPVFAAA